LPEPFTASLAKPAIPEDATSRQQDEQLPVYNACSIDGDVTGELVFVGYGRSWRGIKPKVAAEHGASGCILYSGSVDRFWYSRARR